MLHLGLLNTSHFHFSPWSFSSWRIEFIFLFLPLGFCVFCRADLSWGIWAVGRWDGPHHPGQFRENDHYDPGEFPLAVTLGKLPRHRDPAEPGRALHLYMEDTEGPASRARGEHREAVRAPRTGPPPSLLFEEATPLEPLEPLAPLAPAFGGAGGIFRYFWRYSVIQAPTSRVP